MNLSTTMRDFVDALLHPSVRSDALISARHRTFIAPRLLGSLTALAMLPLYLAWRGAPTLIEVVALSWLVAPILLAYYLSRTGRYESAHVLSSLALTGIVATIALKTGGLTSFVAIWLVIVPLEASLSASRRVVAMSAALALGAATLLMMLDLTGLLPASVIPNPAHGKFMALGIASAGLYATGIALGAESLARTSFWLLYAEEDRYRLLARNMSDVIARHGRNGAVEFVSPGAAHLFGAPTNVLMGHGLFDRVHVADRPAYLSALANAAAGEDVASVEFRVRKDDCSEGQAAARFIWLEMRCRSLEQAGGLAHGSVQVEVVSVMRDITERKMQEQALLDARVDAEQANASKGRFLATMSHELRTPLNAIIGFSDMLTRERELLLGEARREEYARLINESGQHLLAVVNDILDMSKMESGTLELVAEPYEPRDCIVSSCELMSLKAHDQGLVLNTRLPSDLPQMIGDRRAFKQIMLNLLSNAIKFTEQGGAINVSAQVEAAMLKISIEDNGVGISAEDLKRLGDPFFQAGKKTYQRKHEGTGLGLSIVKGLVALHGGQFHVRSQLHEGTCVTFTLPLDYSPDRVLRDQNVTRLPNVRIASPHEERKSA